nr:hypothetical protein [uncultured Acidocella sp.]
MPTQPIEILKIISAGRGLIGANLAHSQFFIFGFQAIEAICGEGPLRCRFTAFAIWRGEVLFPVKKRQDETKNQPSHRQIHNMREAVGSGDPATEGGRQAATEERLLAKFEDWDKPPSANVGQSHFSVEINTVRFRHEIATPIHRDPTPNPDAISAMAIASAA